MTLTKSNEIGKSKEKLSKSNKEELNFSDSKSTVSAIIETIRKDTKKAFSLFSNITEIDKLSAYIK